MGKGMSRSRQHAPERTDGLVRKSIFIRAKSFSIADGAPGWGTVVIGDFPEANICFIGCVANLKFTKTHANIIATWDGDFALGTAPTADGTLNGAEVNIIPSTGTITAVAGVSGAPDTAVNRGSSTGTEAGVIFNNTDGSLEINLNMLIDDASISTGAATMQVDGVVFISYIALGDD